MMKKILIIAAATILFAVTANAQTYVNVGYGLARDKYTVSSLEASVSNSNSVFAGISHNFFIAGNFGIEPGVDYLYNFSSEKESLATLKNRYHGIMVPVLFNYKFDLANDFAFRALLGPVANFGLSDKTMTYADGKKILTVDNYADKSYNRFGVSASVGFAAEWFNVFRLKVSYDFGLNDLNKNDNIGYRQNVLTFTLGYMF